MSIPEHLRLLTRRQVGELLHVHQSTIWRWEKRGEFPVGLPVGKNSVRWRATDVEGWLATISSAGGVKGGQQVGAGYGPNRHPAKS